jgi:hypothetical protein
MFSFQSLDAGQFIIANHPLTLSGQFGRLMIQVINVRVFGLKLIIVLAG